MGATPNKYTELFPVKDGLPFHGLAYWGFVSLAQATPPLPSHSHGSLMEVVLVLKGKQTFSVGGTSYEVEPGNAFFAYPGELHSGGSEPENVSESLTVRFSLDNPSDFLGLSRSMGLDLIARISYLSHRVISVGERGKSLLKDSFSCFQSEDIYTWNMGLPYLASFLYTLSLRDRYSHRLSPKIDAAVRYISSHINEVIMLEDLARVSSLSVARMKTNFKSETGFSPRIYINREKIEEAKKRLLSGMSVTEVAMSLSFGSSDYFSVVFKKYTSMTPLEYRSQKRTQE